MANDSERYERPCNHCPNCKDYCYSDCRKYIKYLEVISGISKPVNIEDNRRNEDD